MMFALYDQVLVNGVPAKITAILSDKRYQVYTRNGDVLCVKEDEIKRI